MSHTKKFPSAKTKQNGDTTVGKAKADQKGNVIELLYFRVLFDVRQEEYIRKIYGEPR